MGLEILPFVFLGCFFVGLGQGLGQFYRFSAVEISTPDLKSRAVTYVLSGGVIAAFLGPLCANNTAEINTHEFLGSYMIIAVIGLFNEITIWFIDFPKPVTPSFDTKLQIAINMATTQNRTIQQIVTQPLFILSCSVATIAHTLMVCNVFRYSYTRLQQVNLYLNL